MTRCSQLVPLVVGLALGGCSKNETVAPESLAGASASATVSASASAKAAVNISPRHGGSIVAVGAHHVELVLFKRGRAEAWVLDAKGLPVKPTASLTLSLKQGDAAPLALSWSKPLVRFAADAHGGLSAVETTLELGLDGNTETGKLAQPVLLVGPSMGGTLVAAGAYGIELAMSAAGDVDALVTGADGSAVAGGISLAINADASDHRMQRIELVWDAKRTLFHGHASAGVKLGAGPVVIFIGDKFAARVPLMGLRAEATHDGHLLAVGSYSVELVSAGKLVSAFVADASATAHVSGDLGLTLMLAGKPITLKWDAPSASYQAKLDAALDLDVQPIEVAIQAEGRVWVGALAAADAKAKLDAALGAPDVDVKADAKAKADAKVAVKAPSVKVPSVKANADAKAGSGQGKASAKAGFSLGTK